MPRGDRTGPLGMGPLTGRRLGFCADSKVPGYLTQVTDENFGLDDEATGVHSGLLE